MQFGALSVAYGIIVSSGPRLHRVKNQQTTPFGHPATLRELHDLGPSSAMIVLDFLDKRVKGCTASRATACRTTVSSANSTMANTPTVSAGIA
jgi:hypothetical protein